MDLDDFDRLARSFERVRQHTRNGAARWEYDGRLVARELEGSAVAIRVPFDVRDVLLREHPQLLSVPRRFQKHMLVVADLARAQDVALEDALRSAWQLQSYHRSDN